MAAPATSGKSAAGLALTGLSVCLWSFTSLPALPVGIAGLALAALGLWDVRRSQGRLKGEGLAVAALLMEAAAMLVFLFLVPSVQRVRDAANRMAST